MHRNNQGAGIGILVGLAAVAATAYWLMNNKRILRRRSLGGWYFRLKGDVLDKIESIRDLSQEAYEKIVDDTARQYAGFKNVDRRELSEVVREMKARWDTIKSQIQKGREEYDDRF